MLTCSRLSEPLSKFNGLCGPLCYTVSRSTGSVPFCTFRYGFLTFVHLSLLSVFLVFLSSPNLSPVCIIRAIWEVKPVPHHLDPLYSLFFAEQQQGVIGQQYAFCRSFTRTGQNSSGGSSIRSTALQTIEL